MEVLVESGIIFVFLLLSYFAGALLFAAAGHPQKGKLTDFFFRVVTGCCALLFFYAVIKAGGKTTILLMVIPAAMLWYSSKKKREGKIFSGLVPPAKWLGISALLIVLVAYFLRHFFESMTLQQDSANYLKIAESLRITGQENTRHFRNVYSELFHGVEPYHYFEMWLAALFMDLSRGLITHMDCLRVCAYGFILSASVLGLISVCENSYPKLKPFHFATALLFLFFVPNIWYLFINYDKHFSYPVECNPLSRINFRTYWLFLLPPIILLLRKQNFTATVCLFLLPIISITTAPAVLSGIGVLFLLNRWTKFYSKKENYLIALLLFIFAAGFFMLFSFCKIKNVEPLYSYTSGYILAYYKSSWKAIVYMIVMEMINLFIVLGPFVLLAILMGGNKRKWKEIIAENKFLLLFSFFVCVSGVVLFQMASFMNNAYQFVFIGYNVVALIVFVLFHFSVSRMEKASFRFVSNTVLIGFLIFSGIKLSGLNRQSLFVGEDTYTKGYHSYSTAYLEAIKQVVTKNPSRPGAYIGDSAYYNKMYYSKRLPDFYFPGSSYYIFAIADDAYQYCLSDTGAIYYGYNGTERDWTFLHQAVKSSIFHIDYYRTADLSIGEKRKSALVKYNIGYVILAPGVVADKEWESMVQTTFTDSKTGERFLSLK